MERYPSSVGIMASLLVVLILGSVLVGAVWAVGTVVSDSVGYVASVVSTGTVERNHTERTRIEADRDVAIARINADVAKKTDFTFLMFWLARFGVWAGSFTMLGAGILWIYERLTDEPTTTTVD